MVAFALRADGWYLRSDIIWSKPNPMPESVKDRPTKAHEYIFLLSKSRQYYYDADAIKEKSSENSHGGGIIGEHRKDFQLGRFQKGLMKAELSEYRNKRSVWEVTTKPYSEAHFATYPEKLIEPCILAGCPEGGIVLDPFFGSGTTGVVATNLNRKYIGIELNPEYAKLAKERIERLTPCLL